MYFSPVLKWAFSSVLILFNLSGFGKPVNDSLIILERYISIDQVCAWPNLSTLANGTQVVSIFNKPSHGRMPGDVECWISEDGGRFWDKKGTSVPHDPMTNRMNVAAGTANNNDLIVIASGWTLKESGENNDLFNLTSVIRAWVSCSGDGGKKWKVHKDAFPVAAIGFTEYIPFGDILEAHDGSLRVMAYNQSNDKAVNTASMFSSSDNGKTWKWLSQMSDGKNTSAFSKGHNETAPFHVGKGKWIAAARRWKAGQAMDLFISNDDGKTWTLESPLTEENQHPGHITRLNDGNLLLTFGNRIQGAFGVGIKMSKDNGQTWGKTRLLINDLTSSDCGYPASVQLKDGSVMTVFYAKGNATHHRYHMGTIIWKII